MSNILDSAAMIAADLRNLADDIAAGRATVGQSVWRSYADRVEEVGTGNAAAMREACTNIAEYANAAKCHTTDAHILGYLDQIESWAKAALAKPPRNCDWRPTWEEAKAAYWHEQGDPADWRKLGAWLFAAKEEVRGEGLPRTEQEGEVK